MNYGERPLVMPIPRLFLYFYNKNEVGSSVSEAEAS